MPKTGGRSTRQWMLWAFKLHGCVDCGRKYPEIPLSDLHCHHVDPSTKVGTRARSTGYGQDKDHGLLDHNSHEALMEELLKCEVVCAECHRDRHKLSRRGGVQMPLIVGTGDWRPN